jgi:predicted nuclease with RNAse H fold
MTASSSRASRRGILTSGILGIVRWLGVDVGGEKKGFDVAVVESNALIRLCGKLTRTQVVDIVENLKPLVVAIDSPRRCAPQGERTRECERRVAKEICGIRWTPDDEAVRARDYYAWIVEGLKLYAALESIHSEVIEVFPTASWTRWFGKRGSKRRSAWTRQGLTKLGLAAVPTRTNQDQRDAIAAAFTARQHTQHMTECIGEIVVPSASL